jgi:type VI secretion system protein ImpI
MTTGFRVLYAGKDSVRGERVLAQLPIRFGRNALNHCQITDGYISDFHATVEVMDNALCVRDLNSKNGVYLPTGQRIPPNTPVPFETTGDCSFLLGGVVRVKVEPFAMDAAIGQRMSGAAGTVIGNRAALQSGSAYPSADAFSRAPSSPPAGGSFVQQPPFVAPAAPAPGPAPYLPPVAGAQAPAPGAAYAQVAAPGQLARMSPGTQQFSVSVETMALLGLQELASSLVPGVPLRTTGDVARLLTKLHDTVEMFCKCFVPLREGHSQFMSSLDLQRAASQRSIHRSPSGLRVEMARDPASVAAGLLDWRNQDYDAPQVVEAILAELMMHQLALLDGVMRGVQALLQELSPARIEQIFDEERPANVSAILGRYRALWQTFALHHEQLTNETRLFELVFGPDFAESYRQYVARHKGATR